MMKSNSFSLLIFLLVSIYLLPPAHASNISGQLDSSFGNQGKILTSVGKGEDRGEMVAVQKDQKIVVAAVAHYRGRSDVAVIRYLQNGELDQTFGSKGIVRTDFGGTERVYGLVIQEDEKILVAGATTNGSGSDFSLVRYNTNGSLDTQFGNLGIVITDLGGDDEIHFIGLLRDQRIVVAGFTDHGEKSLFTLAQYNVDGSLDADFGADGWVTVNWSMNDRFYGLAIQSNGKIVATGSTYNEESKDDCAVVRFNKNGQTDLTFGKEGLVSLPFSLEQDVCAALVVRRNGQILVTGFADNGATKSDFTLAQLLPSGQLDRSFGVNGTLSLDFMGGSDMSHAVALAKSGGIILGGEYEKSSLKSLNRTSSFALAYFQETGTPDTSFGSLGRAMENFGSNGQEVALSMTLQGDGKIILVGHAKKKVAVMRMNP